MSRASLQCLIALDPPDICKILAIFPFKFVIISKCAFSVRVPRLLRLFLFQLPQLLEDRFIILSVASLCMSLLLTTMPVSASCLSLGSFTSRIGSGPNYHQKDNNIYIIYHVLRESSTTNKAPLTWRRTEKNQHHSKEGEWRGKAACMNPIEDDMDHVAPPRGRKRKASPTKDMKNKRV